MIFILFIFYRSVNISADKPVFYYYFYIIFFLSTPSNTAEITVPATSATRYMIAFPTTGNTKIPPCGAISVHPNAIDSAPATAEPTTQDGST